MELVVPAVLDESFLDDLSGVPIAHLYGSLPDDPSLRESGWLPRTDPDRLAAYVARAAGQGRGFFYALNAGCLANEEFTSEGQRWLVDRLGWLVDIGAQGVVLANPYLVAFAKARFPQLQVAVSTAACVDSVDKAQFYEGRGTDVLYLPEYVNRDFRLLRELRKRISCRLVLLANVGCLLHCPLRTFHIQAISHSGRSQQLGTYVDYSLMWCTSEKTRDPGLMVKSPWIRPEDLGVYEALGYDEFKLAGREMDRPWVERVTRAYAARRHDGDLNQLILGFDQMEPFGNVPVRLDNRALDGFVDFFHKKHDCRMGCRDCHYCDDWALRAGRFEADPAAYSGRITRQLARLEEGAFQSRSGF
ncbi:MAG: U32 family peptidase [Acidimicrobiia bacterium]